MIKNAITKNSPVLQSAAILWRASSRDWLRPLTLSVLIALPAMAFATDDAELAKKALNPIADLVSLPLQLNYDQNIGADDDGTRYTLNIQPVIPIHLDEKWNMISRTILPVIDQQNTRPGGDGDASGIGDITQSLFFSPIQPTSEGWIWGVGPVFLIPTASNDLLGSEKWGLGPTAVALKQAHGWTYGGLANHIWSVAGNDDRADISSTFLQPFLSYTTKTYTTLGINTESSYDWKNEQWSVPINLMVTQLLKVHGQPISLQFGIRHWADSAPNGPEGTGFRFSLTFLFPK